VTIEEGEPVRLSSRLRKLEAVAPPARRGKVLPEDPVAFARGLLAGDFVPGDIDPMHPDHMGWMCRMHVFLIMLTPEHQAWLRLQRELDPRSYPGDLLLPAPEDEILAALDEVMRRG
jgi:hypothetical protein